MSVHARTRARECVMYMCVSADIRVTGVRAVRCGGAVLLTEGCERASSTPPCRARKLVLRIDRWCAGRKGVRRSA